MNDPEYPSINLFYHELQLHLTQDLQVSGSFLTVCLIQGFHLRIITEGFLQNCKGKGTLALSTNQNTLRDGQETFTDTAKTSLHTKIHAKLADVLTEAAVDSILVINKKDKHTRYKKKFKN